MDASLHAVSLRKGERLSATATAELQARWWRDYGGAVIREVRPDRIIAIGKGLNTSLGSWIEFADWMYQPQGARYTEQRERNAKVLKDMRTWLES
jgi:hypothetical protein